MIEDEPGLILTVGDRLVSERYEFDSASDGISGEEKALRERYSLILLDVMLPGKDGFEICKNLRGRGNVTPILMLTAKSQVNDRVVGLKISYNFV